MSSGRTGTRVSVSAGRRAHRGDDRGGRCDRRRLGDAVEPVGRVRLGELEDLGAHRRHVEDRRNQVVGEGGVAKAAVGELDLLHQREPEPLGDPALDLPLHRDRVDGPADVLRGGDLDHPHQPELDIDVDHGAVRRERKRQVSIALAVLVERECLARAVLARRLERVVADQLRERVRRGRIGRRPDSAPLRARAATRGPPRRHL